VAYNPPATLGVTNGGFINTDVALNAYLGLSNLRIRFNYDSPSGASSWGIDNVRIAPSPFVPTVYQWSGPGVNTAAQTITVTPPVGTHVYNLTSQTGTCSFVTTQVTVIVNGRPSIALTDTALKVCQNTGAQALNLPYDSPIYTPTNYNLTWSTSPTNSFAPITGAALPGSGVTINVPAGTAPGLYSGVIFVTNSNGCNGPGKPFTVRVVAPPVVALVPIGPTACVGEPTFIPSGATSTAFGYQWELSTDGGANYTTIVNGSVYDNATTATLKVLNPTIAMIDYLYRLKATATDPCNNIVTSIGVKIKLRNVWLGTVSTDWQVGANWSDGNVASIICDDVHVLNRPNQARLTYGISTITNLIVYPGAFLTIDAAKMQIRGTMTNSNNTGTILARRGTIELNGTFGVTQIIPATIFQNNALLNLILDNPSGVNVAGALDIYRSVTYEGTGRNINTFGFLTLKSNTEETAWLGTTTGNTIVGDVTIERHMYPIKSWRLMATPVDIATSPSIFNSWQEGTTSLASTGFGTQITGPGAPAGGLDTYTQRGSLKYFDPNIQNYVEMTSTAGPIARTTGYYVFVRGDKSVPIFGAAGETNLKIKGKVLTGPQSFGVLPNKFASVGNPYPCRVAIQAVLNTSVVRAFTTWNPNFAGAYGVGAFENYVRELSPPYNYRLNGVSSGAILNHIESGQAVFVQSIPGGTITVNESDKIDGSALYSRNEYDGSNINVPTLEVSMHTTNPDGTPFVADGAVINFDDRFSAGIDNLDAKKITNAVDNFSIRRNQTNLAADRRPSLKPTDTLQFFITNMRNANYQLQIKPFVLNYPDLQAYFIDNFLKTETPLSLTAPTDVNFSVTSAAESRTPNRFFIVFKQVPPIILTDISAERKADNTVSVRWSVANENNIEKYIVEQSVDNMNFRTIATQLPNANDFTNVSYHYVDVAASSQANWYRVKAVTKSSSHINTDIVKVNALEKDVQRAITVYPNPVTNRQLNLLITNLTAGKYSIVIKSSGGQLVASSSIDVTGAKLVKRIDLNNAAAGNYQAIVTSDDGLKYVIQFVVQ